MPTVNFDISDEVANLIEGFKDNPPGDFNPGQRVAWAAATCQIQTAVVSVRIAGRSVDVTTDISVKCSGADYISQSLAKIEETASMLGKNLENQRTELSKKYIAEAFDSL